MESPRIIGLGGAKGAGKDTAAKLLGERFGFEPIAFADPLRDMLYQLNPIVHTDLIHGTFLDRWRVRELVDAWGWDHAKQSTPEVRLLLQRLGTEAGRQVLGDDVWVHALIERLPDEAKHPWLPRERARRFAVTDVRFPNEQEAIRGFGGECWLVMNPEAPINDDHPSEQLAADRAAWDRIVVNDSTLYDLDQRLADAIQQAST